MLLGVCDVAGGKPADPVSPARCLWSRSESMQQQSQFSIATACTTTCNIPATNSPLQLQCIACIQSASKLACHLLILLCNKQGDGASPGPAHSRLAVRCICGMLGWFQSSRQLCSPAVVLHASCCAHKPA
jgi:hypothetical protein